MTGEFRCSSCNNLASIEVITEGEVPDCCHDSFVKWAGDMHNAAVKAVFVRHSKLFELARQTLDEMASTAITSDDPSLRAAAMKWRQRDKAASE